MRTVLEAYGLGANQGAGDTPKSSSPANFRSATEPHPNSRRMARARESCTQRIQTRLYKVEVSVFRNGQLGGGCLVSLPQAELASTKRQFDRFPCNRKAAPTASWGSRFGACGFPGPGQKPRSHRADRISQPLIANHLKSPAFSTQFENRLASPASDRQSKLVFCKYNFSCPNSISKKNSNASGIWSAWEK